MAAESLYRALKSAVSTNRLFRRMVFGLCAHVPSRFVPRILTIALTYRCPCRCVHCGVADYKNGETPELSTSETKELIDRAVALGSFVQVTFTGGEALLREDLIELVAHSKSHGFFTKIDTNAGLLDAVRLRRLKEAGIDRVDISIDHFEARAHDALRRCDGLYEKAIAAARRCREEGIQTYFQTYATRQNIADGTLEKIIELSETLGVPRIKIQPPAVLGSWKNHPEVALAREDYSSLDRVLSRHRSAYFESEFYAPGGHEGICKIVLKGTVYVTCYGDVLACCYLPVSFGSIRSRDLGAILDSMRAWQVSLWKERKRSCLCSDASFRNEFFSGAGRLPAPARQT